MWDNESVRISNSPKSTVSLGSSFLPLTGGLIDGGLGVRGNITHEAGYISTINSVNAIGMRTQYIQRNDQKTTSTQPTSSPGLYFDDSKVYYMDDVYTGSTDGKEIATIGDLKQNIKVLFEGSSTGSFTAPGLLDGRVFLWYGKHEGEGGTGFMMFTSNDIGKNLVPAVFNKTG